MQHPKMDEPVIRLKHFIFVGTTMGGSWFVGFCFHGRYIIPSLVDNVEYVGSGNSRRGTHLSKKPVIRTQGTLQRGPAKFELWLDDNELRIFQYDRQGRWIMCKELPIRGPCLSCQRSQRERILVGECSWHNTSCQETILSITGEQQS